MTSSVNSAITDSITAANTLVMASSPAQSMASLMLSVSQSLSAAAQNMVTAQQQANVLHQAATVQGINALQNTGNAVTGAVSGQLIG